jgi:NADPH:quinone reductase-like Zn-dependent oxidoreductase
VLVRVAAAGVGPWDVWMGKSVLPRPLPLTLGSDLSGTVAAVGPGVVGRRLGEEVYGVTNARFTGAYPRLPRRRGSRPPTVATGEAPQAKNRLW